MGDIERWECPKHGDTACFDAASNAPGWCIECEGPVVRVEYVRADLHRGAVEALREIRDNLGVPGEGYPAPVAYAYKIANDWLTANRG